jgi:hypothetical protein
VLDRAVSLADQVACCNERWSAEVLAAKEQREAATIWAMGIKRLCRVAKSAGGNVRHIDSDGSSGSGMGREVDGGLGSSSRGPAATKPTSPANSFAAKVHHQLQSAPKLLIPNASTAVTATANTTEANGAWGACTELLHAGDVSRALFPSPSSLKQPQAEAPPLAESEHAARPGADHPPNFPSKPRLRRFTELFSRRSAASSLVTSSSSHR